jgi:hypothetical protein
MLSSCLCLSLQNSSFLQVFQPKLCTFFLLSCMCCMPHPVISPSHDHPNNNCWHFSEWNVFHKRKGKSFFFLFLLSYSHLANLNMHSHENHSYWITPCVLKFTIEQHELIIRISYKQNMFLNYSISIQIFTS